jgi:hypothetical protein
MGSKLEWLRSVLPCDRWTELATRPRSPDLDEPAPWTPILGAQFTVDQANEFMDSALAGRVW